MHLGKCENCEYLKSLVDRLQEDNKQLLNQLLVAKNANPIVKTYVEAEEEPTKEEQGETYGIE